MHPSIRIAGQAIFLAAFCFQTQFGRQQIVVQRANAHIVLKHEALQLA